MVDLIARTRTLINDTAQTPVFVDQDVQDMLDRYRIVARFVPLRPEPTFIPGGIVHYWDYFAEFPDWEQGEILYDNAYNVIDYAPPVGHGTLVSRDLLTGHWIFQDNAAALPIAMPFGQIPRVRLSGFTYDIYMAAASLLEDWAAKFMLEFNFSSNQQTFYRNQQQEMILKMADRYKTKARPQGAIIFRNDQTDASALPPGEWLGSGYYAS